MRLPYQRQAGGQIAQVVAGAMFLAMLVGASAQAGNSNAAISRALREDLTNYLSSRSQIEHISAASLSINLNGGSSIINLAAGTTSYGGGAAMSPANLFQIGSNTKAFTAVALLQLEEAGKLTIEQTVGDWMPEYPAWKGVTIRRLLNMTSGIPSYDNQPAFMNRYAGDPMRSFTPAQLVAFVYPRDGKGPPPTHGWSYSNTNYILAQMIIERATRQSYASEIRRRFFGPRYGLTDAYYRPSFYPSAVTARMPAGYFFSTDPGNTDLAPLVGRNVRDFNLSWTQGAGGIVATPEDVAKWARALYRGSVLAPKQRAEMMQIVSDRTGQPIAVTDARHLRGFGLAVGQVYVPTIGALWYYEGETLGYRMLYAYLPNQDAVIGVALNSQPDAKQDQIGKLMETVYGTLHAAGNL